VSQERRQDPRADARLEVGVRAGDDAQAFTVSSLNVSAGGVYVQVPHFIEPLTKLALTLDVPAPTPGEDPVRIEAEAIVVRTVPEQPQEDVESYEVACAFLELRDDYRDAIHRYILTHRAESPT